ncbi:MAG: cysteine synthase family protein [Patescibacteria group bacterium]
MNYSNILNLIGNTPLVEIKKLNPNSRIKLLAKLEYLNPGGSVKDRIAIAMIERAEQEGKLKSGGTIVEPTSGNTGVGLAMAAAIKGYKTIFVMPDKMSQEKRDLLTAYGSKVIITPTKVSPEDPRSYYQVAAKLVKEIKGAFMPNQYANPANPLAHYNTTGPEIWRQTKGQITHVVIGAGTGGTISGVGKFLKEKNPQVKVIAVDPVGSVYAEYFKSKKIKSIFKTYKLEGVGEDFIPQTIDFSVIDQVITVTDKQAFLATRQLVRKEGILAGGSSGMAFYAAQKIATTVVANSTVVVIFPDSGKSYLSKIFNHLWLKENL